MSETMGVTQPNHEGNLEKLHSLAKSRGIETSYYSSFEKQIDADPEALVAILNAMNVDAAALKLKPDLSNLDSVLKSEALENTTKKTVEMVEPVWVFWEGEVRGAIEVRGLKAPASSKTKLQAQLTIRREDGKTVKRLIPINFAAGTGQASFEVGEKLPFGYHEVIVEVGKAKQEVLIISAPWTSYVPVKKNFRALGVFAPLYALKSSKSWGIGDFSDLALLADWALKSGADFVGTLPMLSIFNGGKLVEPSPYSPLSRLHWNEMYVDLTKAPELKRSAKAKKLVASTAFKARIKKLQATEQVDYKEVAQAKREVLDLLAEEFFKAKKDKTKEFKAFLKLYPSVIDYAQFRATYEKREATWQDWPERLRNGDLKKGDYDEANVRTHVYAQWLAHSQLGDIAAKTKRKAWGIYVDFPLSAHGGGYDVWRERSSFVMEASAGAPPDPTFVHGQDWGILPLNPVSIRRNHYRYVRKSLETQMRYAGILRLDHVMGFYRLFWVPPGLGAKRGVYVKYRVDEFFAILMLESHRHQCVLIGEDLGTVPPEVREAMEAHGVLRMAIQQFGIGSDELFSWMPDNCICSLNTHDLPTFASYWKGLDIEDQCDLGYFPKEEIPHRKDGRERAKAGVINLLKREGVLKKEKPEMKDVLAAILKRTAQHPVRVMQVSLEDLWFEEKPQNTPGTTCERPNWVRKCRMSLDQLVKKQTLARFMLKLADLRKAPSRAFE